MITEIQSMAIRIKELRNILSITQSEMAEVTGTSLAEYQEYEKGEKDMSFTFLYKCARRFGLDISELVTGDIPKLSIYNICRAGAGMPINRREGFVYHHVASLLKNRLSEPFVVTAKYAGEDAPIELLTHPGQEFDYVLEGKMKVQIDEDHVEILNEGDSIYYNSTHPHGMIAIGGADCKFIAVVVKGENIDAAENTEDTSAHINTDDKLLYHKYVNEVLDENGFLKDISFNIPDNFNFAFDVLDELAKKYPNKVAMTWLSKDHQHRDFTFSDISRYSNKTANYLTSLGIKKGDKVVLVMKRHYQFWFTICALHKIGAVAIPATNQLATKDFEYRFNAADVRCAICTVDGDVIKYVDEAAPRCPSLEIKISVNGEAEGWRNYDKEIELFSDQFERPADHMVTDTMLMYFTSGTASYPKIATHDYSYPLGHIVTARFWQNVDPNGLHLTISDTGWGKAVWGKLYGQWFCEAAIFTYDFDRFHADDILPLFKQFNITTFCAPPTMYRFFIREDLSKYDLSSIKHATIAGEALNPEVFEQFRAATGLKIMEGFGQTETTLVAANLIGMIPKPGSMGKPNPQYDVDLVDHQGNSTKVGEVGEIVIKTDKGHPCGMFTEYYKDEEKTTEAWYNDLYHTGDMAWRDEDGYYWFVGRADDLIKSSGYRIGPFEIESVLMELPYVLECAVTGVPDETRGQLVKATIILTKDTKPSDELKKEIQQYVKEHTAPYKYPRIVEFVTELPKTISGKIQRKLIRNQEQ